MLVDNFFPRLKLIALPLATSLFFLGAPLANADDIFVQIRDIPGESLDRTYREAIDALSWGWGMEQSASTHMGGYSGGKINIHDLTFTHFVDKATPRLMELCSTGRRIPSARLTVRRSGENRVEYLVIDMEDIVVSKVSTGGPAQPGRPIAEVTLNFAKVRLNYRPIKPDGSTDAAIEYGWDIAANTKL